MAQLLVVEDDATIGGVLRSSLAAHGHDVVWALTGADALRVAADRLFDLVLLDLGLPDMDGIDVCRGLRSAQPPAVLVVLTARDEEIDVVVGLEAGADDYLTKPFRLGELLARIHAHLRRSQPTKSSKVSANGLLRVDGQTRRAYLGEAELPLRAKEFDLLSRFLASPGAALSRATLMADVWDPRWFGSTKALDVHVSSLRAQTAGCRGPGRGQAAGHPGGEGVRIPPRERRQGLRSRHVGTRARCPDVAESAVAAIVAGRGCRCGSQLAQDGDRRFPGDPGCPAADGGEGGQGDQGDDAQV